MNSVRRSLRILELITGAEHPLTHAEMSRALDIPKSTLSQLLDSLCRAGYVAASGRRYYTGVALAALAFQVAYDGGLRTATKPKMEELAQQTRETVLLGVRAGPGVVMIEQAPSPQPIRYVTTIGQLRPLHATGTGRVFLAFTGTSAHSLADLPQVTPSTVTDPDEIDRILERIRRDGYALNRGEAVEGVSAISAPLFDDTGRPVAVLSVTGPSERFDRAIGDIWPLLRSSIESISLTQAVSGEPG